MSSKGKQAKQTQHVGFLRQLTVLTDRTLKVTYRDPMGMVGAIGESILMAIITGYIFYDLQRTQAGIRSRQGALYISVGLQGYLFLLFEIYRLTMDVPTFDRESSEGCVTALPFILSRRIARMFTEDVPVPFLYSVIFYFMLGLEADPAKFFTFFSIILLNHYIAVTLAMTAVAAIRHFPGASLIANLSYTLQSMACGYFIQSNTIPVYVRWLKYLTYAVSILPSVPRREITYLRLRSTMRSAPSAEMSSRGTSMTVRSPVASRTPPAASTRGTTSWTTWASRKTGSRGPSSSCSPSSSSSSLSPGSDLRS